MGKQILTNLDKPLTKTENNKTKILALQKMLDKKSLTKKASLFLFQLFLSSIFCQVRIVV